MPYALANIMPGPIIHHPCFGNALSAQPPLGGLAQAGAANASAKPADDPNKLRVDMWTARVGGVPKTLRELRDRTIALFTQPNVGAWEPVVAEWLADGSTSYSSRTSMESIEKSVEAAIKIVWQQVAEARVELTGTVYGVVVRGPDVEIRSTIAGATAEVKMRASMIQEQSISKIVSARINAPKEAGDVQF